MSLRSVAPYLELAGLRRMESAAEVITSTLDGVIVGEASERDGENPERP